MVIDYGWAFIAAQYILRGLIFWSGAAWLLYAGKMYIQRVRPGPWWRPRCWQVFAANRLSATGPLMSIISFAWGFEALWRSVIYIRVAFHGGGLSPISNQIWITPWGMSIVTTVVLVAYVTLIRILAGSWRDVLLSKLTCGAILVVGAWVPIAWHWAEMLG